MIKAIVILTIISTASWAQEDSYPTSPWLNIKYEDNSGQLKHTCGQDSLIAERDKSYVSLRVNNIMIFRESRWNDMFRRGMNTFAAGGISAKLANAEYTVEKVSPTYRIKRRQDTYVDIPTGWTLLDKIPWNISKGDVTVKVGFSDKSLIKSVIDDFSATVGAENITLNAAWTSGLNIISFLDSVANTSDDVKFLSYSNDIPFGADALCDGRYVVFAAPESQSYRNYQVKKEELILRDSVLMFNDNIINDVSYVIFSIGVVNKKYAPIEKYMDSGTLWAQKYADARRSFSNLVRKLNTAKEIIRVGDLDDAAYIIDRDTKLQMLAKLFSKDNRKLLDTEFNKLKSEGDILLKLDKTLYQSEKDDIENSIANDFDKTVVGATIILKQYDLLDTEDKRKAVSQKMISQDLESGVINQSIALELNSKYARGEFEKIDENFVKNNFSNQFEFEQQINLNDFKLQDQIKIKDLLQNGVKFDELKNIDLKNQINLPEVKKDF